LTITVLPFSFNFLKKQKCGHLCPSEKVLVAKIDLHENEWVYCSKPLLVLANTQKHSLVFTIKEMIKLRDCNKKKPKTKEFNHFITTQ